MSAAGVILVAVVAQAVPEGSTGEPPKVLDVTVNGYLDTRLTAQRVRTDRLLPATDTPRVANLTEANLQLRLRWGDRGFALADASFLYQKAGGYPGTGDHDVPAYRPLAVLSESYGSLTLSDHANLTLGKKRVVWGPGFFVNPTDLLNPPKDPTDPLRERAGAWLARVEFPFERFTISAVGAARVMREYAGVPADLLFYPPWQREPPAGDDEPHFAASLRVYALLADTDVNLESFFTNLYNDAFRDKSRLGLSASRLVGKALEVHLEALGQLGSARLYPDDVCVPAAILAMSDLPCRTRLDDRTLVVRALAGARYTFADDSMLQAEYLFQSDGLSNDEWRRVLDLLAAAAGRPLPGFGPPPAAGAGTPQKYAFEPLRRHYLVLGYVKPRIRDDFTLNLTALASLHDLGGQFAPSLAWSAREWLTLSLDLFAPLPGIASWKEDVDGTRTGEFDLQAADWRAFASARAWY